LEKSISLAIDKVALAALFFGCWMDIACEAVTSFSSKPLHPFLVHLPAQSDYQQINEYI
jgi:hypothetical protein